MMRFPFWKIGIGDYPLIGGVAGSSVSWWLAGHSHPETLGATMMRQHVSSLERLSGFGGAHVPVPDRAPIERTASDVSGAPPSRACVAIRSILALRRARARGLATMMFVGAALCACAQTTDNLPPIPLVSTPEAGTPATLPAYKTQVGDLLDVRLFLNPELNEAVVVRPDGMISTTLAEDVPAVNRTPAEISADLRQRYIVNLKDPKISVIVHSFAPNRIYVAGEVANPGEFVTVGPNLTISQAIARAGGVKLSAQRSRIFVIRRGPNDTPQAFAVNYMDVISGNSPAGDARLAQYDVVYVPRTGVYEVWTFWNQFVQQFVPVSWGFSYNINSAVSGTGN
jgi:polysaccharide export outer membrane protein